MENLPREEGRKFERLKGLSVELFFFLIKSAGCDMIVIGLKLSITRQRKNLTTLVECVVTPIGVAV